MKCPYCHKHHPKHFKYCPEYGLELPKVEYDINDYDVCVVYNFIDEKGDEIFAETMKEKQDFLSDEQVAEMAKNVRLCVKFPIFNDEEKEFIMDEQNRKKMASPYMEIRLIPAKLLF